MREMESQDETVMGFKIILLDKGCSPLEFPMIFRQMADACRRSMEDRSVAFARWHSIASTDYDGEHGKGITLEFRWKVKPCER